MQGNEPSPKQPVKSRLLFFLIGISVLSILFIVAAYLYSGRYGFSLLSIKREPTTVANRYPAEVVSYDVTQKEAIFDILDVKAEEKSMLLTFLFPSELRGSTVMARIECPLEDSWVTQVVDDKQLLTQRTRASEPLYLLADPDKDSLKGICKDQNCTIIYRNCELFSQSF